MRPGKLISRRKKLAAFTIADVVVAAFVLGTIGGTFCIGLSTGFYVLQTTREDLRATQIMMQKIEAIRLCTWSQLTNFTFTESYDPLSGTNSSAGAKYFGNVSLSSATTVPSAYSSNMCVVTVNLAWTNYNLNVPIPHGRQMLTQVARYGLQNYIFGAP